MNPLAGKPLRYLIGADKDSIVIERDAVTVLPFDWEKPILDQLAVIAYGNLYWQKGAPPCPPYLDNTDTADEYDERVVDPRGRGWKKNLTWQFARWKKLGAAYIELDNPDAYAIEHVIGAIELAASYGLKVIAKNPGLMSSGAAVRYVRHPNVYGIIVEKGAGNASTMDELRRKASKPDLPVWFVAFGRAGKTWANTIAKAARSYRHMGVTHSSRGEYGNSIDILKPRS